MKPYFQNEAVTLYHGNSVALLPQLDLPVFDAAITDPPYSSGGLAASVRAGSPSSKYCQDGNTCGRPEFAGDNKDQRSFGFWCTLWLSLVYSKLRESGYCLIFSDWRQVPTVTDVFQAGGLVWRGIVPWDKGPGSRSPHTGYFRHQAEYVVWGTRGPCRKAAHKRRLDGVIQQPVRQADKHHMTGKPTALMRQLVEVVPPGSLILDLFAGSGTTGVAAIETGRRAVLFEIEEAYCEIAARRLENAQLAA